MTTKMLRVVCSRALGSQFRRQYSSALEQNWKDRQDLAACYRIIHDWPGFQVGAVFNHLTVRTKSSNPDYTDGQDVLLVVGEGVHWAEVTASNLVEVDVQTGFKLVQGSSLPIMTASVIHSGIHRDRPWSKALFHLHPTNITAISCLENPEYPIVHQDLSMLHNEIEFDSHYESSYREGKKNEEGSRLSEELGDKSVLIHANHGASILGRTIADALSFTYYLEWGAQLILTGQATGRAFKQIAEEEILAFKKGTVKYDENQLFFEACRRYIVKKYPELLY